MTHVLPIILTSDMQKISYCVSNHCYGFCSCLQLMRYLPSTKSQVQSHVSLRGIYYGGISASTFSSTELASEAVTAHTMRLYTWRGFLTLTLDEGEWRASSLAAFALGKELQVRTEQGSDWPVCRSRHFRKERHLLGKFLAFGSNGTMIRMV